MMSTPRASSARAMVTFDGTSIEKPGACSPSRNVVSNTTILEESWLMEFILTLILMTVILGVSTGSKEKGVLAGIAIGAVIGLEAMFAGPVSGASMNPIRSLAPAVVSGRLEHVWVYLTAPVAGAIAGVGVWAVIRPRENGL